MSNLIKNPFRQLYVGESVGPDEFVKLFSPILVKYSLVLFQSGNLVIKGFTGAGKSMLLNLLDPAIRIAYSKSDVAFPVPQEYSKFIGAGINLQTSGVSHFGRRQIMDKDQSLSAIYFGDYLNYYVVSDIMQNIRKIISCEEVADEIGVSTNRKTLDTFAIELARHSSWFGYFGNDILNYDQLYESIRNRITSYKSYLNFNTESLSEKIVNTKTFIGEPIAATANLLKQHNVINDDVEIFVKIDQYEELVWLGAINGIGSQYQDMIHGLLGSRDSSVSYRIGTRHFAWADEKTMFGTTAKLEKKRNYLEFHLDNEMKRKETTRNWIFPELAEDIFKRRVTCNGYDFIKKKSSILKHVFGSSDDSKAEALKYFSEKNRHKAVEYDKGWPKEWNDFLKLLAQKDPLGARLAEAYARQKGKGEIVNNIPVEAPFPWEKTYWKKERIEQALIQLASRNNQQLNWSGYEDVLALSGGNILAFLSLCQHIWDVWLRDSRHDIVDNPSLLPKFDSVVQSAGIIEASLDWFNELAIDERGGKNRKKLVTYLGIHFFKTLLGDKAMSNPGHNGFSLDVEEMENHKEIFNFLKECMDYGDLYDSPHTSKLKDKKRRHKFYLNPVLSPYFKVPYVHTKEPIYLSMSRFIDWLIDAGVKIESIDLKIKYGKGKAASTKTKKNEGTDNLLFDF